MPKIPYDELNDQKRADFLNYAINILQFKPELLGNVTTYSELLDKLTEYSKELYERFPAFTRSGTVDTVQLRT